MIANVGGTDLTVGINIRDLAVDDRARWVFLFDQVPGAVVLVVNTAAAGVAQAFGSRVKAVGEMLNVVFLEVVLIVVFVDAMRDLQEILSAGCGATVVASNRGN